MKRNGSFFIKKIIRHGLIFFICLYTTAAFAQIDTLFKFSTDQRLIKLWTIAELDFFKTTDSARVFNSLDTVIDLAKKNNDDRLVWYARYFQKLYNGRKWRNVKLEIEEMKKMEPWINNCPQPVIKASYQHFLGNLLFDDLRFAEAFDLMLKAQKSFEKIGLNNIPEVGHYISQLGNNYYIFEDYTKALTYLNLSKAYPSFVPNVNISKLNSIGLVYQKTKDYSRAKDAFKDAMALANKLNDSAWIGIATGNYGYTLSLQGNDKEAIPYLLLDYNINRQHEPKNTAITSLYLANSYTRTGDFKNAQLFLQIGLQLEGAINDPVFFLTYYQVMARYHAATGNYFLAYRYKDSVVQFKDSLKAMFNSNILASAERRIEAETFLANTALIKEQQRSQILKKNSVIIAVTALLCLGLLLLYQKNKTLKRNKKEQAHKEELLNAQKNIVEEKLIAAETQLKTYINNIAEKNVLIARINTELTELQNSGNAHFAADKMQRLNELTQFTILTEADWINFKQLFDKVYPNFFIMVKEQFPDFTPAETRLLSLLKLNLSHREMSSMLGISADTITKTKYRLRKKLTGLKLNKDLEQLVNEL